VAEHFSIVRRSTRTTASRESALLAAAAEHGGEDAVETAIHAVSRPARRTLDGRGGSTLRPLACDPPPHAARSSQFDLQSAWSGFCSISGNRLVSAQSGWVWAREWVPGPRAQPVARAPAMPNICDRPSHWRTLGPGRTAGRLCGVGL